MTQQYTQKGFSLPELLIVVVIFVALSVMMLVSYNSFSSRIVLENKAHEVAQSIREAQVYAMGVKSSASASALFPGYGVYFDQANPNSYIFYRDLPSNPNIQEYDNIVGTCGDTSGQVECLKVISLPKGIVFDVANLRLDGPAPSGNLVNAVSITFTRPKPDAKIHGGGVVGSNIEIPIMSTKGYKKKIVVYSTGQISVR